MTTPPRPILLEDVVGFVAISLLLGFCAALHSVVNGRLRLSTFCHALSVLYLVLVGGVLLDFEFDDELLRALLGMEKARQQQIDSGDGGGGSIVQGARKRYRQGALFWLPMLEQHKRAASERYLAKYLSKHGERVAVTRTASMVFL